MPRNPLEPRRLAAVLLAVAVLASAGSAAAQEATAPSSASAPAPRLRVEEVVVTPADPAADTLCKLTVKLHNAGEQTASLLAFEVAVGGQRLPVYDTELFALPVEPGATTEVPLSNL
jgi:hypothetical protein